MLGDSPMVTGTWYNPKTGHSFTAKDTFFEDNNMYVLTTDGQRIDGNMLSQYIQSDNPTRDKQEFAKPQPAHAVLPPEVAGAVLPPETTQSKLTEGMAPAISAEDAQYMTEEDRALLAGNKLTAGMGNPVNPELGNIYKPEDEDTMLVRRMLKKAEAPAINFTLQWNGFPRKQMDMLDTMGVDYEKIAAFYMREFDIKAIQELIKQAIVDGIDKRLAGEDEPQNSAVITIKKEEPKEEPKAPEKEEKPAEKPVKPKREAAKKPTAKKPAKKPAKK